jgi:hypothetical protein
LPGRPYSLLKSLQVLKTEALPFACIICQL